MPEEVPALPEIASPSKTRIAQLGEHRTRHPRVVGSNPTPGRNFRISTNQSNTNRNLLLELDVRGKKAHVAENHIRFNEFHPPFQ